MNYILVTVCPIQDYNRYSFSVFDRSFNKLTTFQGRVDENRLKTYGDNVNEGIEVEAFKDAVWWAIYNELFKTELKIIIDSEQIHQMLNGEKEPETTVDYITIETLELLVLFDNISVIEDDGRHFVSSLSASCISEEDLSPLIYMRVREIERDIYEHQSLQSELFKVVEKGNADHGNLIKCSHAIISHLEERITVLEELAEKYSIENNQALKHTPKDKEKDDLSSAAVMSETDTSSAASNSTILTDLSSTTEEDSTEGSLGSVFQILSNQQVEDTLDNQRKAFDAQVYIEKELNKKHNDEGENELRKHEDIDNIPKNFIQLQEKIEEHIVSKHSLHNQVFDMSKASTKHLLSEPYITRIQLFKELKNTPEYFEMLSHSESALVVTGWKYTKKERFIIHYLEKGVKKHKILKFSLNNQKLVKSLNNQNMQTPTLLRLLMYLTKENRPYTHIHFIDENKPWNYNVFAETTSPHGKKTRNLLIQWFKSKQSHKNYLTKNKKLKPYYIHIYTL